MSFGISGVLQKGYSVTDTWKNEIQTLMKTLKMQDWVQIKWIVRKRRENILKKGTFLDDRYEEEDCISPVYWKQH